MKWNIHLLPLVMSLNFLLQLNQQSRHLCYLKIPQIILVQLIHLLIYLLIHLLTHLLIHGFPNQFYSKMTLTILEIVYYHQMQLNLEYLKMYILQIKMDYLLMRVDLISFYLILIIINMRMRMFKLNYHLNQLNQLKIHFIKENNKIITWLLFY